MAYSLPIPCGLPKATVDKFATDIARKLGYRSGQDLLPIVEGLKGKVTLQDIFESDFATSGSILVEPDGKFEIFLAAHTGAVRDRFTVAHELGHLFLHFFYNKRRGLVVDGLKATRYGSGQVEWEANWFAAGFLMPEDEFRIACQKHGSNISAIATIFDVSVEAVRVRQKYFNVGN